MFKKAKYKCPHTEDTPDMVIFEEFVSEFRKAYVRFTNGSANGGYSSKVILYDLYRFCEIMLKNIQRTRYLRGDPKLKMHERYERVKQKYLDNPDPNKRKRIFLSKLTKHYKTAKELKEKTEKLNHYFKKPPKEKTRPCTRERDAHGVFVKWDKNKREGHSESFDIMI